MAERETLSATSKGLSKVHPSIQKLITKLDGLDGKEIAKALKAVSTLCKNAKNRRDISQTEAIELISELLTSEEFVVKEASTLCLRNIVADEVIADRFIKVGTLEFLVVLVNDESLAVKTNAWKALSVFAGFDKEAVKCQLKTLNAQAGLRSEHKIVVKEATLLICTLFKGEELNAILSEPNLREIYDHNLAFIVKEMESK